jgi:hypothetical protein
MIAIENTLVSEDLVKKKFVCDLNKCKGACCVQGDAGAPVAPDEYEALERNYEKVKPYLTQKGIEAVEKYGLYITDKDGDVVTPLVGGNKECAYTIYENGIAACGIEKAYTEGKSDFRKPVSCHLYPVRITYYKDYDAVNYHDWEICDPACKLGRSLKVPVFRFLKDALIRKYGIHWYEKLEVAAAGLSR